MSRKDDSSGLRSPRLALPSAIASNINSNNSRSNTSSRSPILPLQFYSHHVDADALSRDDSDERSVFQRYVAETLSPSRGTSSAAHAPAAAAPRLVIRSPRLQQPPISPACAETTMSLLSSLSSPRTATKRRQLDMPSSQSPLSGRYMMRPCSPVGELPPEVAIASPRTPRRRAILAQSDVDKITQWLESLARETRAFGSYYLYCETLFRESRVLYQDKPTPNRLQTAVAFHCLCKATSVFARHEDVLAAICRDLGAALFVNHDALPIGAGEIEALECFSHLLTYYDNQRQLEQQRDNHYDDIRKQRAHYEQRLRDEQLKLGTLQDLEQRYQIKQLDTISHRTTTQNELHDRLTGVLQHFQHIDDTDKQKVVLSVIDSLRAHVTADTLFAITEHMSMYEKDKLLHQLFQGEIGQITEKIRSEVLMSMSAQQNAILERSVTRITRFQALISGLVHPPSTDSTAAAGDSIDVDGSQQSQPQSQHTDFRTLLSDDDLCDQDRKVLEAVSDVVDELELEKRRSAVLTAKLDEAEQLVTSLRWKLNAHLAEAQDATVKHATDVEGLQRELANRATASEDKAVQTDRRGIGGGDDGDDDDDDTDDRDGRRGGAHGKHRASRRRPTSNDDEDLILKNRRVNKLGVGIASIIEQAKIPSSKIRKILSKRKPLTLNELHAIIVGYYQAKMFQDVQDDNAGKLRSNLAQFIMEMYVLHYGLKDLAISQLVFLDASIRKHARESARVRTFGLLTGSLDPESHACSVQGIDFFLFVVVVIFNAGVYKKGRKQAVAIAQNLKAIFGDGIFLSAKATTVKSDLVCQAVDLVFSFTRNDPGGALDQLKDELRRGNGAVCGLPAVGAVVSAANAASSNASSLEIDFVLEKVMNYWFQVYEQQIQDIHAMFALVDANGDGMLDFREFCEIVVVLEPDIDRRDALALYNRAAGDDHVIDKDEFVQVMLAHQRGLILKEFYSGDSSKKIIMGIQQRKHTLGGNASASPSSRGAGIDAAEAATLSTHSTASVEYQSLAGAMDELDREESYASLAAAMSSIATRAAANGLDDDEDDDEENDAVASRSTSDSAGGSGMTENVSFMTLSRLSVWAAEAKGKLLGVKATPPSSTALPSASALVQARKKPANSALRPVLEQSTDGDFETEVDTLLREALSKANIHVDDLLE